MHNLRKMCKRCYCSFHIIANGRVHSACIILFTAMGKKLRLSLLAPSLPEGRLVNIESGHSGCLLPVGGDGLGRSRPGVGVGSQRSIQPS